MFWGVVACLIETYQLFGEKWCSHLQGIRMGFILNIKAAHLIKTLITLNHTACRQNPQNSDLHSPVHSCKNLQTKIVRYEIRQSRKHMLTSQHCTMEITAVCGCASHSLHQWHMCYNTHGRYQFSNAYLLAKHDLQLGLHQYAIMSSLNSVWMCILMTTNRKLIIIV